MANEVEMLEVETPESQIVSLRSENQRLEENNQRLQSTVSDLQQRLGSLRSDYQRMESRLDQAVKDRDFFSIDLDEKKKEIDRLTSDYQELERSYEENLGELLRIRTKSKDLKKANEKLDRQIFSTAEDSEKIMVAVFTTQSDLEKDLEKQTEILKTFFNKTLEMVKDTATRIEQGEPYGADFVDEVVLGLDPAVEVMIQSIAVELAGVRRAFMGNVERMEKMLKAMRIMRRRLADHEQSSS